jgi:hypothetical protein
VAVEVDAGAPLHECGGSAENIIPFARSMGLPLTFVFPERPRSWPKAPHDNIAGPGDGTRPIVPVLD